MGHSHALRGPDGYAGHRCGAAPAVPAESAAVTKWPKHLDATQTPSVERPAESPAEQTNWDAHHFFWRTRSGLRHITFEASFSTGISPWFRTVPGTQFSGFRRSQASVRRRNQQSHAVGVIPNLATIGHALRRAMLRSPGEGVAGSQTKGRTTEKSARADKCRWRT